MRNNRNVNYKRKDRPAGAMQPNMEDEEGEEEGASARNIAEIAITNTTAVGIERETSEIGH